jgi:glyceraldehyde-3-phosphate dehydrogenase (NADP+)
VSSACKAYGQGRGVWPQMTTAERIERVIKFTKMLKNVREQIVEMLMWEICKNRTDAEKEVDRTIKYIYDTIAELKNLENKQSMLVSDSGIR